MPRSVRSTRTADSTPSLFDEPDHVVVVDDVADEADAEDDAEDWVEVSQAYFLSWSDALQLHYCYRRDLDSALRADSTNDAQFFLSRAASYKQAYDELQA